MKYDFLQVADRENEEKTRLVSGGKRAKQLCLFFMPSKALKVRFTWENVVVRSAFYDVHYFGL